jgi:hypothetical protein
MGVGGGVEGMILYCNGSCKGCSVPVALARAAQHRSTVHSMQLLI